MSSQSKWTADDQAAKIMNEVSEELNIKSSDVNEIIQSYYYNVAKLMDESMFPKIKILGLGMMRPTAAFIDRRIKKLGRINKNGVNDKLIQEMQVASNRIKLFRKKCTQTLKENKLKHQIKSNEQLY